MDEGEHTDGGALDAALLGLHGTDAEFGGGLSNHGPMAAEALEAMGHPDRIAPFVAHYGRRLTPLVRGEPLPRGQWAHALGRVELRGSLVASFVEELRVEDPARVLARSVAVLAPGVIGAAFHGVLRTAHAWRAWLRAPSEARRVELAHGLAYWAARHQGLPGDPGRHAIVGRSPAAVLAAVPVVPTQGAGLILDRFAVLDGDAAFITAVESYDPDALPVDAALDELLAAVAQAYLAAPTARERFVFLHGITSTSAVRTLLPALRHDDRVGLVAHQVAAIAAVQATHGRTGAPPPTVVPAAVDWSSLAATASRSRDDHTIKLVQACMHEAARGASPLLGVVAQHRLAAE